MPYLVQELEGLIYAASVSAPLHPNLPVVLKKEMIMKNDVNTKTVQLGVSSEIVKVF